MPNPPDAAQTTRRAPFTARKSTREGQVSVAVKLSARGWSGDALRVEGSADLTSAQARELAQALVAAADAADAKVSARAAAKVRRDAWREREIAAGRMVVLGRL